MDNSDVYRKLSNLYMELAFHEQCYKALTIECETDYVLLHIHIKARDNKLMEIGELMLKIS